MASLSIFSNISSFNKANNTKNVAPAFIPVAAASSAYAPSSCFRSSTNPICLRSSTSHFTPALPSEMTLPRSSLSPRSVRMVVEQPSSSSSTDVATTDHIVTDTRRKQLYDIITSGPVYRRAALTMTPEDETYCVTDSFQTCLDDWIEMGSILEEALGSQANDVRVYQYYLPIYFWINRELDRHLDMERDAPAGTKHRPFILGFSCPQGGGKTTMTTFMQTLLRAMGKKVQIASLDDFYVTNKEQCAIAAQHPSNRLMQFRGMPGTHDLPLLIDTLDRLRKSEPVSIPRYDKSAHGGRGDRAPKDQWKHISEQTDVILFEGWCLGFEPVKKDSVIDPDLDVVNRALVDFTHIYSRLDGLFLIEIENIEWVYDWRLQAERGARAAGKVGLTDEQVVDFVDRFMPAYKQYSQHLYRRPTPLIPKHELHIEIDENRRPVTQPHFGPQ